MIPLPRGWTRSPPAGPQTCAGDSARNAVKERAEGTTASFGTKPAARGINRARRGAESYPTSCTDLPPHTASSVPCIPLTQPLVQYSDVPQKFTYEKYQQTERTRGRAQHHPFRDAHGHTNAYTALGREGSQCLTGQKPLTQTILPTSYREAQSSHQTGFLHTKTGTFKQPLYREPFGLRFHPEGGSALTNPRENMAA